MNQSLLYQAIYIVGLLIIGGIFGLVYRTVLKAFAKPGIRQRSKNIGSVDRWTRALCGVVLLVWAAFTGWGAIALIGSGFCFFEAAFSWCGLYAAIGKNTCPIE